MMLIKNNYAMVDANGFVLQVSSRMEDNEGPNLPMDSEHTYYPLPNPIDWSLQPTPTSRLQWMGLGVQPEWVDLRTLEQARADKTAEMSSACASAILSGFTSSALGAEYLYPAKITDQTNLAGSVLDSLLPGPADWATPFWCADAAGVWEFRMHTATQIQQVGRDAKAAILAAMSYNEALRAQIATATLEQLGAIGWAP